jgi:hypothetical protein
MHARPDKNRPVHAGSSIDRRGRFCGTQRRGHSDMPAGPGNGSGQSKVKIGH